LEVVGVGCAPGLVRKRISLYIHIVTKTVATGHKILPWNVSLGYQSAAKSSNFTLWVRTFPQGYSKIEHMYFEKLNKTEVVARK
jgi:hypothetical protein